MNVLKNRVTGQYVTVSKDFVPGTPTPVVVFRDVEYNTLLVLGDRRPAETLCAIFGMLLDGGRHEIEFLFQDRNGNNFYADAEIREVAEGEPHDVAVARFIARTYVVVPA